MSEMIEFLKIIIPTIAVLIVVYIMMREFTRQNSKQFDFLKEEQRLLKVKMENEKKSNNSKTSMPLRFKAYERMSLFLERINPPNLITRVLKPNANVKVLHSSLLTTIREEYEHNLSQQLYVSDTAWELVKAAKEDVVRLVNSAATKFNSDDDANKFAQEIITHGFNTKHNPIDSAISALKDDIRVNFA
ncbi:MAG TPA: hypothetical protein QF480_06490 [Bacteroidales bacterium]|jgi:hypothetical protein|nr:hypothetical protein [Bacteroidota bacterium]HJN06245.1 hypothetical protein [Bacteroidales bacterium]|tara:strand:- start:32 stop:598 length:567 start_codon:yes stop_codon:yes gene_type:complete